MGVPGFFAWLIKKYGKHENKHNVTNNIILHNIPERIDYFLIDTNGIIHPLCFKVRDENKTLTDLDELEDKMINEVISYLENIIKLMNPSKGVYIAIDGVAPMAKIKHQRTRRFKSYVDKKILDNIKKKYNKDMDDIYWNNSAITPGTVFMEKLHEALLTFCEYISKSLKLNIIYSSYLTPGEGEHKLLKYMNTNPEYVYSIYGLDADLIFLSFASKARNIYLTRDKIDNDSEDILHIPIKSMKKKLSDTILKTVSNIYTETLKFDINNLIRDFVFICYFLGNDFLPHLVAINIHGSGLDSLLKAYITSIINVFNMHNNISYLIEDDYNINEEILKVFINELSLNEDSMIKNNAMHRTLHKEYEKNTYEYELNKLENLLFKFNDPIKLGSDSYDNYRKRYYAYYCNATTDSEIEKYAKKTVKEYIIGLQWTLKYYFIDCPSWKWHYPYIHAPFINDIKLYMPLNINDIDFKLSKPVLPFIQLMLVLPKQSSYLLPKVIKKEITDKKSQLTHLYPTHIVQDFINKKKYWMAVPILPTINLKLIKQIYTTIKDKLHTSDIIRNRTVDIYNFYCNKV